MFTKNFLLLELDAFEAEFYHLPPYVPYFQSEQKNLEKNGFSWDSCIKAIKSLLEQDTSPEYKQYKLFVKKWPLYQQLTTSLDAQKWHEAEKFASKILSIDLLDPCAYYNLGYIFRNLGNPYQAEISYRKGMELVTIKIPFLAGLAKTYQEINKLDDAMYYWHEVYQQSHDELEKIPIIASTVSEAEGALINLKVFRSNSKIANKSFIGFVNSSDTNTAIYEQETIDLVSDLQNPLSDKVLEPDENYIRLVQRSFHLNFNEREKLNDIGVKLVHYGRQQEVTKSSEMTELAVKIFERVYELSKRFESRESDYVTN